MRLVTVAVIPIFAASLLAQERTRSETTTTTTIERESDANLAFDVRYHDDRGKLVVAERGLNFEDVSNAKHSRSWSYAQINFFKRKTAYEIKIEPYSGDSFEFHLEGSGLSEAAYKII